MDNSIKTRIEFELLQLDQLLFSYNNVLERVQQQTPDLVELTAIASVLHSFYNGVESIFIQIVRSSGEALPTGERWHQQLLRAVTTASAFREAVISPELASELAEYLAFRHFFRHSYSFFLDWEKVKPLAGQLRAVWNHVKVEIELFLGQ